MLKIKEVLIISPGNLLFLEGLQGFPCRFDSVFSCVKVMRLCCGWKVGFASETLN